MKNLSQGTSNFQLGNYAIGRSLHFAPNFNAKEENENSKDAKKDKDEDDDDESMIERDKERHEELEKARKKLEKEKKEEVELAKRKLSTTLMRKRVFEIVNILNMEYKASLLQRVRFPLTSKAEGEGENQGDGVGGKKLCDKETEKYADKQMEESASNKNCAKHFRHKAGKKGKKLEKVSNVKIKRVSDHSSSSSNAQHIRFIKVRGRNRGKKFAKITDVRDLYHKPGARIDPRMSMMRRRR